MLVRCGLQQVGNGCVRVCSYVLAALHVSHHTVTIICDRAPNMSEWQGSILLPLTVVAWFIGAKLANIRYYSIQNKLRFLLDTTYADQRLQRRRGSWVRAMHFGFAGMREAPDRAGGGRWQASAFSLDEEEKEDEKHARKAAARGALRAVAALSGLAKRTAAPSDGRKFDLVQLLRRSIKSALMTASEHVHGSPYDDPVETTTQEGLHPLFYFSHVRWWDGAFQMCH
jgi:hypothetical protein